MNNNENKPIGANDYGEYESVGLFYGGFVMIGMAVGAFAGFMIGGGQEDFLAGGWIDSIIGVVTGLFIGVGVGLICHGSVVSKKKKR
jgi:hypothetical protein